MESNTITTLRIVAEVLPNPDDPECARTRARVMGATNAYDFSGAPTIVSHDFGVHREDAMISHAQSLAAWHHFNTELRMWVNDQDQSASIWIDLHDEVDHSYS